VAPRFYVETLGCPKNAVDSDKVVASLLADGLTPASQAEDADLIVVNTCAFVEAAHRSVVLDPDGGRHGPMIARRCRP
jgi:ribosomal protein S12 methylthiotransferase